LGFFTRLTGTLLHVLLVFWANLLAVLESLHDFKRFPLLIFFFLDACRGNLFLQHTHDPPNPTSPSIVPVPHAQVVESLHRFYYSLGPLVPGGCLSLCLLSRFPAAVHFAGFFSTFPRRRNPSPQPRFFIQREQPRFVFDFLPSFECS